MLVLAALERGESYGYALVATLRNAGLADLSTGSVYPVLTRLERERLIVSRIVPSAAGPARKYYAPTADGRRELDRARSSWLHLCGVVGTLVPAPAPDPGGT